MKRKTKLEIYRKLRFLFNVMMGIGFLLLSYLTMLIAYSSNSLGNNALSILVIALCAMGQISHYHDAYKAIRKDLSYYIGITPPAIALGCLIFAVTKIYFFG